MFRTINALIAGPLTSELGLDAANLGLLTSVYFLTFAAAQIPIGALLDRYGPRRVQSILLLIAAAGAALFAASQRFLPLVVGRAMIGLGVAASLTAGLKAVVLWFPKERVALLNGCMIMLGALGAVTATTPAERLLGWIAWRGLFELLAMATALAAAIIYFTVPEPIARQANCSSPASLRTIYADRRFWKIAPLSATCVGSAWALQGLWAAAWFTDVERLSREALIEHLFIMALAVSVGALVLGAVADRLCRHGVGPETLLAVVAAASIAAQLALVFRLPLPTVLPWSVVAAVGVGTVLSYAILAEYFPKELAGRANAALNVFHLGWAFVVQYATGLILAQWPHGGGHYPTIAYQVAFGLNAAIQTAALVWFLLQRPHDLSSVSRPRLPNLRFACELVPAYDGSGRARSRPDEGVGYVGYWWAHRGDAAERHYSSQLDDCDRAPVTGDWLSQNIGCHMDADADRAANIAYATRQWPEAVGRAVAFLLSEWLFSWLIIVTMRWVARGFRTWHEIIQHVDADKPRRARGSGARREPTANGVGRSAKSVELGLEERLVIERGARGGRKTDAMNFAEPVQRADRTQDVLARGLAVSCSCGGRPDCGCAVAPSLRRRGHPTARYWWRGLFLAVRGGAGLLFLCDHGCQQAFARLQSVGKVGGRVCGVDVADCICAAVGSPGTELLR